jgi:hypothetical protein
MTTIIIEKLVKGYSVTVRSGFLNKQEFAFETVDKVIEFIKGVL